MSHVIVLGKTEHLSGLLLTEYRNIFGQLIS